MASIYPKRGRLWARVKDGKRWIGRATPYLEGQEAAAQRFADELQRLLDAESVAAATAPRDLTVEAYAREWIASRRKRGIRSVNDDEARLAIHVLPAIGNLRLAEMRPRNVRSLVQALRERGTLAPRTVRNVYGVLRTMLSDAQADELIALDPCRLKRGDLPPNVDADPSWRAGATFTRAEVGTLLSDVRLLPDRRILYAVKALTGMRHSEAAELRWSQYDPDLDPLGGLDLHRTKTDVPRRVPVHPKLAAILDAWKREGWEATYGRAPRAEDLVIPTRAFTVRAAAQAWKDLQHDLEQLGMRARRGHDFRRTFITFAREDGADDRKLKAITHGVGRAIIDVYTSWTWPALCAEVAKLRVRIPRSRGASSLATTLATRSNAAVKRWETARENLATPTGFESAPGPAEPVPVDEVRVTPKPVEAGGAGFDRAAVARLATQLARAALAGDDSRAEVLVDEIVVRMRRRRIAS